jgi:hypothetical protein
LEIAVAFRPAIGNLLLVSPATVVECDDFETNHSFAGAIEKSRELASFYEYFAGKYSCRFLDASSIIMSSPLDGVHLDEKAHRDLAQGIWKKVG